MTPQPLGWGFLLVAGFLILAFRPEVEAFFPNTLVGFSLSFLGYAGLAWHLFQNPSPMSSGWKWGGIVLACGLRILMIPIQPCDDLYRYAWEAKVERAGFSAARLAPNHSDLVGLRDVNFTRLNHPDVPTVYPRAAQWFFQSGFPENEAGAIRWKILLGMADLIGMLLLANLSWPTAFIYGLHPLLIFEGTGRGHFEPIGIAFLILSWIGIRHRKDAWFGFSTAMAISIKPLAALVVVPWLLTRPWQRWRAYPALTIIALSLSDVMWATGTTLSQFVGETQYNSLIPGALKSLWSWASPPAPRFANGAWISPAALIGFSVWLLRRHFKTYLDWGTERLLVWLLGILLVTSTVFHPWYILWILPFAAAQRNPFWLGYAGMQILALWPYYRQIQGEPWREIPGLKWLLIAVPFLVWLYIHWSSRTQTGKQAM